MIALGPAAIEIESRAVIVAKPEPDAPDATPPRSLEVEVEALRPDPEFAPLGPEQPGSLPLAAAVEQPVITEQRRLLRATTALLGGSGGTPGRDLESAAFRRLWGADAHERAMDRFAARRARG